MKKILILSLCFSLLPSLALAAPAITSVSGTVQNDQIITVSGSNFGTKRTPTNYDYFDEYTSDWSRNSDVVNPGNPPTTTGITWGQYWLDGTCLTAGQGWCKYPHPLLNINQDDTCYSTGRAFNEWPEYLVTASGPDSNLIYDFTASSEVFATFYVKFASNWPTPYAPVEDKEMEFWKSSGQKAYVKVVGGGLWWNVGVEGATPNKNFSDQGIAGQQVLGKWQEIKIYMKMNTWVGGVNQTDGIVYLWVDGVKVLNVTNARLDAIDGTKFNSVRIRGNFSGSTDDFGDPPNNRGMLINEEYLISYSNIMFNYSSNDQTGGILPGVAKVWLSNQSTWGSGPTDIINGDSNFVRQVVGGTVDAYLGFKSWSNISLKFKVNKGSLTGSTYLYVTNWNGETNLSGFSLTGLPDTTPPAAPSGVIIS